MAELKMAAVATRRAWETVLDGRTEDCVVGAAEVVESTADVMRGAWIRLGDVPVVHVLRLDVSGIEVEELGRSTDDVDAVEVDDEESVGVVGAVEIGGGMLDS